MHSPCRFYEYANCSTCRKAAAFLVSRGIPFERIPIRETPPTAGELRRMLKIKGGLKPLFNTHGHDYRSMNLSARLPSLPEEEAIRLLSENGNLVKRPFLLCADGRGTVGFSPAEWEALFPAVSGT